MQGPDTEAQDQPPPFIHIRLATHGRSIQVHTVGSIAYRSLAAGPDAKSAVARKLNDSNTRMLIASITEEYGIKRM